jgi:hypothetical protein
MKKLIVTLMSCTACGARIDMVGNDATVDAVIMESAAPDAGASDVVDAGFAWPDAALLQACADAGWIIHVDNVDGGYPIDASTATITGALGTWGLMDNDGQIFQLSVLADSTWGVSGASDWQNGKSLEPGTYTSSGDDHVGSWMQVQVANQGCFDVPTGTFTVFWFDATNLLMSFSLVCDGQGTLTGCVRYGG